VIALGLSAGITDCTPVRCTVNQLASRIKISNVQFSIATRPRYTSIALVQSQAGAGGSRACNQQQVSIEGQTQPVRSHKRCAGRTSTKYFFLLIPSHVFLTSVAARLMKSSLHRQTGRCRFLLTALALPDSSITHTSYIRAVYSPSTSSGPTAAICSNWPAVHHVASTPTAVGKGRAQVRWWW
jgi:hypothetical protein